MTTCLAGAFLLFSSLAYAASPLSDANILPAAPSAALGSATVQPEVGSVSDATEEQAAASAQAIQGIDTRPFHGLAVGVTVSAGGFGFDLATPLSRHLNLRGGASFLSYSDSILSDGITYNGDLKFNTVRMNVDYYPWGGSFRLSPWVVLHNGNHMDGTATVPAGSTFQLNSVPYTSSATDPLRGSGTLNLGNNIAPSFTLGWGNMLPRKGRRWSVPFEVGFEYVGQPTVALNLAGTVCQGAYCVNAATDPTFQANRQKEQDQLNSDLSPLRFYPIVSIGLSYRLK